MNKEQSERNKRKSRHVEIVLRDGCQQVERSDGTFAVFNTPKRADDFDTEDFLKLLLFKKDAENYTVDHRDSSGCGDSKIRPTSWNAITKK